MSALRENDLAVLNYIFDPNISGNYDIFQSVEGSNNQSEDPEFIDPKNAKANDLELAGVRAAEHGNLEEAVELFSEALSVVERASGYNNRAQAYRLLGKERDAMEDLEKAVRLSGGKGKTGCQAFCQRGILYRKLGADIKAKSDFTAAARLGSKFAQKQLIEMNPYAAMCNQMLHQMMFQKNENLKENLS